MGKPLLITYSDALSSKRLHRGGSLKKKFSSASPSLKILMNFRILPKDQRRRSAYRILGD